MATTGAATVQVKNLKLVQRHLARFDKEASKAVRRELREIAKPVALSAQQLAAGEISRIGPAWQLMRIGAPAGGLYVVPKQHRKLGGTRPNFAGLLWERAMDPAQRQHERRLHVEIDQALTRLVHRFN